MSEINKPSTLDTVIIFTERMQELADFYATLLNIGPYGSSPSHLGCSLGHVYFGFDQVDKVEGAAPGGVTIWFRVEDLQETYDRAVSMGAKVRYPPTRKPWGGFLACVYDLDGNMLGLAQNQPPR